LESENILFIFVELIKQIIMEIKLDITKIVVIITQGPDIISVYLNSESPFPLVQYEPCLKMEAQHGYGEEYVKQVFKINPEIINTNKK
jgi:hypothetical protein